MSTMIDGLGGELVLAATEYSSRDRTKWLAARRAGLGASETATILGLNDFATPLSVWNEKMSTAAPEERDIGPKARWGQILEDTVARQVSKEYLAKDGLKIAPTPGLLRHPDHPWMLATLDRLVVPRSSKERERAVSILEVKTTGGWNYRHHWLDGVPPAYIQVQVQQQLAVSGLPYALVGCLVDGYDLREPVRIDRDETVIEQIITYAGQWWEQHVVAGVRPEATFADRSIMHEVYPGDAGLPSVIADDDLETHLGLYDHHRTQEREHKERKERAQFEVQKRMGDALAVNDREGRTRATWKPSTTNRVDATALKRDHPDLAELYTTTSTSRRFLIKEIGA